MGPMKLRLIMIGGINALISVGLLAARGISNLYLAYMGISLVVLFAGIIIR